MRKLLVSCDELAALLGEPSVRVLDMRWPVGNGPDGVALYRRERVPGAAYLGFAATQRPDPVTTGRAADPVALAGLLTGLGVDITTTVIAYDDNHQFTAARLVWLLRGYGFRRAYRLDGGWPAWLRAGGPIETGAAVPPRPATHPLRLDPASAAIATLEEVRTQQAAGLPIVDCRRDASWREAPRLIPGATRLPMRMLLDATGLYLRPAQIRTVAAAAGISPQTPAIAYCGAAISAAAVWLALCSAGMTDVCVYDGSITEWVATGQHTASAPP